MRSRDRKDRYVEAYWSRSGRYRSSAAVAGYGTEERVVISFLAFIDDAFAQFVIYNGIALRSDRRAALKKVSVWFPIVIIVMAVHSACYGTMMRSRFRSKMFCSTFSPETKVL